MNELAEQFETLPPHSIPAEQCTLASLLIAGDRDFPGMRRRIMLALKPANFFLKDHEIIAARMWAMSEKGTPIDAVTLREELTKCGQLDEIGGTAYLAELLNTVPSAANGETYAATVRDKAARRWLIARAGTLWTAAHDGENEPVKIAAALRDSLDPFIARLAPNNDRSGGAGEYRQRASDMADGKIVNIDFPGFPRLSKMVQALLPGSMGMFVGTPGDGKTFGMLSWIAKWKAAGIPVSVLMAEGTRAWHLNRFIAMAWEDRNMLDPLWHQQNRALSMEREEATRDMVEEVGSCIHETAINSMTLSDAADWVEQQAEKSRIVIIDPVTVLDAGSQSWNADKRLAARTKKAMERHGGSAIFVTHPKKGARPTSMITMDDIAGGQAYQGFSDFILSIYKHVPHKDVEVTKMGYPEQLAVNRTLYINKARNGIGGGQRIAADFSASLQWSELGVITKDIKTRSYGEAV